MSVWTVKDSEGKEISKTEELQYTKSNGTAVLKISIAKPNGTFKDVITKVTKDNKKVVKSLNWYISGTTRKVNKIVTPDGKAKKKTVYKDKNGQLKKKVVTQSYKNTKGIKIDKKTIVKASGEKVITIQYTRTNGTKKTVIKTYNTEGQMISSTTVDTAKISK